MILCNFGGKNCVKECPSRNLSFSSLNKWKTLQKFFYHLRYHQRKNNQEIYQQINIKLIVFGLISGKKIKKLAGLKKHQTLKLQELSVIFMDTFINCFFIVRLKQCHDLNQTFLRVVFFLAWISKCWNRNKNLW